MMKMRRFTSQHVELMTKRQDLCLQRRSRPEQSDQRQPNQAANISHQPRASPDSTALTSRIEFPTMTGAKDKEHAMSQTPNTAIAVIGIDIGKNSFHVVAHDARGAIVLRQKWPRGQVEARIAKIR